MITETLFSLAGRKALVTGGSRGIGRALALAFADAGAEVMICGRQVKDLEAAADELRGTTGRRIEFEVADLSCREQAERLADQAVQKMGGIDILVNNAGYNVVQSIDAVEDTTWDGLLELNLSSCMALTRALAPGMKERRWGRVIHISSIMALASTAGRNAYSATKAALVGLAKASALDLGPFQVTVNCIAPGPIATEMPMSILSQEQQDQLANRTALGRWGKPEELQGVALLLASEAGAYITGSVFVVDGGATSRMF